MNLSKLWEIVENREAWRATVHGVTESWTRLSDFTFTFLFKPAGAERAALFLQAPARQVVSAVDEEGKARRG